MEKLKEKLNIYLNGLKKNIFLIKNNYRKQAKKSLMNQKVDFTQKIGGLSYLSVIIKINIDILRKPLIQ